MTPIIPAAIIPVILCQRYDSFGFATVMRNNFFTVDVLKKSLFEL